MILECTAEGKIQETVDGWYKDLANRDWLKNKHKIDTHGDWLKKKHKTDTHGEAKSIWVDGKLLYLKKEKKKKSLNALFTGLWDNQDKLQ